MSRYVGHILLVLVVLVCPVQCVVGAGSCCASVSDYCVGSTATESDQNCPEHHCCQSEASGPEDSVVDSGNPTHVPPVDDNCHCDCLCKGAIASASSIAYEFDAALLMFADAVGNDVFHAAADTPSDGPPVSNSGRRIRTLRMSFQI